MPTKEQFGANIKAIRESKGYSVRQVAMWADLNPSTVSMLENGKRNIPKISTIEKLAHGLREPVNNIIELAGYIPDENTFSYAPNNKNDEHVNKLDKKFEEELLLAFDGKPIPEEDKKKILEYVEFLKLKHRSDNE
ncbi:helix-turn-helix domain-containing protein [Leuconostoc mesenteroides]|uniref:helix-turn-helix domain-containing protein n=1 Tax=Leuconostoc mesenteroides TaxID=1245 RepID=UPI0010AE7F84|nr:transcriptional regulator [Leuconostoc mesenteroides]TJY30621.1 helix-turn-helix transcriptional regulator [Leuconostoc mesenteroides subsp. mesenteroides]